MKKRSVILILIGLMVASYPLMEQLFAWYWQHRLLSEWEKPVHVVEALSGLQNMNIIEKAASEEGNKEDKKDKKTPLTPQGEILGVLRIDCIDVKLPIIKGLNETNLKIGVAFLEDTPFPGGKGNTVLAGHRGHSSGRLLNRLNEVALNDQIIISTKKDVYHYTVFNKVIVKPEETDILRSVSKEKILTIVACEPIYRPTHRLIVQAKLDP